MSSYYPAHDLESISPNENPLYMDAYGPGVTGGGSSSAPSPGQMPSLAMQNSKRAYRQRRKDPSCDACRERKVKCDATETSSCSECSSRNVRCQFTKDTNRRMSSMKQVQDLERQLNETRQQLDRVRAAEHSHDPSIDLRADAAFQAATEVPAIGRSPRRMLKATMKQDLTSARYHISDYGRGLLKPPVNAPPARTVTEQPPHPSHQLDLPPRPDGDIMLELYYETIHRQFPVLHWPTFHQNYVAAYERDGLQAMTASEVVILFVVFACGALRTRDPERVRQAQDFVSRTLPLYNLWDNELNVSRAVGAFLVSIFLVELNRMSAAWIWHGTAVRTAQDLGLHIQGGEWSQIDGELRKRVWYSFYIWDRLLALETGKPMMINDDECDTEYPEPSHEERVMTNEPDQPPSITILLAHIHIARISGSLARLFRSLCITNETLSRFESHFRECLSLFPPTLQLDVPTLLDPCVMSPLISFQNSRILLHRHNLSPACSSEQRIQAIDQCVKASRDTAKMMLRLFPAPVPGREVKTRLLVATTTLFCTHLWRCMLFLLIRQHYEAFMAILQVSALIGDSHPTNICCGRYIAFFLRRLIEQSEQMPRYMLEQDEELLVYLSADLQSSTNSWVWGSAETGTLLSRRQKHGRPKHQTKETGHSPPSVVQSSSWDSVLGEEEQHEWGGWQHIEQLCRRLVQVQDAQQSVLDRARSNEGPAGKSSEQSTFTARPQISSSTAVETADNTRSRLKIADLI